MGDFSIDVNASEPGKDKLDEFCNLFYLTNLVRKVICCTNNHRSTISDCNWTRTQNHLVLKRVRDMTRTYNQQ